MLTWLANLLSGGALDRTERRVEELERERDYAWGEFRQESERTEWQTEQHLHWRELHHRAVQQRDQAGQDLAWVTRARGTWKAWANQLQMVAKEWEKNADADNRSRRGWRWLYEAKCAEWAAEVQFVRMSMACTETWENRFVAERGLRDGWQQTAGELQYEVTHWMNALTEERKQADNNLQRVEAERDEALGQLLDVGLERDPETGRFLSRD